MKTVKVVVALSVLTFIMIRGMLHVVKIPFQSAHCEAD